MRGRVGGDRAADHVAGNWGCDMGAVGNWCMADDDWVVANDGWCVQNSVVDERGGQNWSGWRQEWAMGDHGCSWGEQVRGASDSDEASEEDDAL